MDRNDDEAREVLQQLAAQAYCGLLSPLWDAIHRAAALGPVQMELNNDRDAEQVLLSMPAVDVGNAVPLLAVVRFSADRERWLLALQSKGYTIRETSLGNGYQHFTVRKQGAGTHACLGFTTHAQQERLRAFGNPSPAQLAILQDLFQVGATVELRVVAVGEDGTWCRERLDDLQLEQQAMLLAAKHERYAHGECHVLVVALQRLTGWPIGAVLEEHETIGTCLVHAFIDAGDHVIDVAGLRPYDTALDEYAPEGPTERLMVRDNFVEMLGEGGLSSTVFEPKVIAALPLARELLRLACRQLASMVNSANAESMGDEAALSA